MAEVLKVQPGDRYGRLTIIEEAPRRREPSGMTYRVVVCRCDCGTIKTLRLSQIRKGGLDVSCGCKQREVARKLALLQTTHGMTKTPIHNTWIQMI